MPKDGVIEEISTANIKRISHLDLAGMGQVEVQGNYAYIGHMDPPNGTSIVDISDLKNPKVVSEIKLEGDENHTHKVRINGDIMITNVEMNNRHFLRRGDKLPGIRAQLEADGKDASDSAAAAVLGVKESDIAVLDEARERGYHQGGFKVYDVSDRTAPKELCHIKTHGFGTHRFDADENYAYISTEVEGYVGNILVTYDMADPSNPTEVSRWWMPGQHVAGGETPTAEGYGDRLHHALRFGDEMWAACWDAGFWVIDVSDIKNPKTLGSYSNHPPVLEPSHTFMPLVDPIDGRRIAIAMDEQHKPVHGQPPAGMWVMDVTDLSDMKVLSEFNLSEMECPHSRKGGRFGAHQYHEKPIGTLVFATWFSGGLRIIDVADPFHPVEVGYYMPDPINGYPTPQSNDVFVGDDGIIFLADRDGGLDILEYDG